MDSNASEVMTNNNTQLTIITITSLAALSVAVYYLMGGFARCVFTTK